jgi:hypothetical protein
VGEYPNIDPALAAQAEYRCEYCHYPMAIAEFAFELDHIIAKKHRGKDDRENLAVSCFYCNSFKGPNIAGIDPESGEIVRLFHPRKDPWDIHFQWQGATLTGLTSIGRATIQVLFINHPDAVAIRESLMSEGVFRR